jgi:hypothetical protein
MAEPWNVLAHLRFDPRCIRCPYCGARWVGTQTAARRTQDEFALDIHLPIHGVLTYSSLIDAIVSNPDAMAKVLLDSADGFAEAIRIATRDR